MPSPHSYENTTEIFTKHMSKKGSTIKMSTSERRFDFSKFGQINREFIVKGLL